MNVRLLSRVGWRYLRRHAWQSILMVLGITLGVAVAVAIDLANASASRAFDLSTEAVTGRTTHQITGGPQGLDEAVYTRLRLESPFDVMAPVMMEYVNSPELGGRPLQLLGIDPLADAPFRSYLGSGETDQPLSSDLSVFLTQPGALLISARLADEFELAPCDNVLSAENYESLQPPNCKITLAVASQPRQAFIAGLIGSPAETDPEDRLTDTAMQGILLADISTAQELTGRLGRIDRIDLILPPEQASRLLEQIEALLPPDAVLQAAQARSGTVEEMTDAFRLNLTALSLLALIVGLFLIYNTMTFSVVQRRSLFGTLRSLGMTRQEVFWLVTTEALMIGLAGSVLGIGLGILLGQAAVQLVTQTINDLYFVVTVRGVQIPLSSLIKGLLLGIVATGLTAAAPAWEAASIPPRAALSRSGLESKTRKIIRAAAWAGIALLGSGTVVLLLATKSLGASFMGTFAVIVGCAALAPYATLLFMKLAEPVLGRLFGTLGRMAPRNVVSALSRTSVAVSALMVAISVTIGVSLMVSSFRFTVVEWLDQTLQGDLYISASGQTATRSSAILDPRVVTLVQSWPEVSRVDVLRSVIVDSPQGAAHIAATDNLHLSQERIFLSTALPVKELDAALRQGAILVSEPFANRLELPKRDAVVTLYTVAGPKEFPVAGVYYDYASSEGTILMDLEVYRQAWQDEALTAMAVRVVDGANLEETAQGLGTATAQYQNLLVRPTRTLREDVLDVFDRTFAITSALQLLATVVAFIGVLSAFLSLLLERQRELGILRAIGLTTGQLWKLIMGETGLMGFVAGLLAMPTGLLLSLILVYIINKRSFGWTLQLEITPWPFLQALLVGVLAALLAGLYPAQRISKLQAAEAIHSE